MKSGASKTALGREEPAMAATRESSPSPLVKFESRHFSLARWKKITTLSARPSEVWAQLMEFASVQLYKVSGFRGMGTFSLFEKTESQSHLLFYRLEFEPKPGEANSLLASRQRPSSRISHQNPGPWISQHAHRWIPLANL